MSRLRIAIAGASGRMGHMLIEAALRAPDIELAAALDQAGSDTIGRDAGELVGMPSCGVRVASDVHAGLARADCLIDFTRPEGTMAHLAACAARGVSVVIGTTGLSPEQKHAVREASVLPA